MYQVFTTTALSPSLMLIGMATLQHQRLEHWWRLWERMCPDTRSVTWSGKWILMKMELSSSMSLWRWEAILECCICCEVWVLVSVSLYTLEIHVQWRLKPHRTVPAKRGTTLCTYSCVGRLPQSSQVLPFMEQMCGKSFWYPVFQCRCFYQNLMLINVDFESCSFIVFHWQEEVITSGKWGHSTETSLQTLMH